MAAEAIAAAAACRKAAASATAGERTVEAYASRILHTIDCAVMTLRPWPGPSPPGLVAPKGGNIDDHDVLMAVGGSKSLLVVTELVDLAEQTAARHLVSRACRVLTPKGVIVVLALCFPKGINDHKELDAAQSLFEVALSCGADDVLSDPPWNTEELKTLMSVAHNRWLRSTAKCELTLHSQPYPPESETAALQARRHHLLFSEVSRHLMPQLPGVNTNLVEEPTGVATYRFADLVADGRCRIVEANDDQNSDTVVVKITDKSTIATLNDIEGLYRELVLLRTTLKHPNVARCREVLHGQRFIYHVLDHAGDRALDAVLASRAGFRLDPREIDVCVIQVTEALRHCHDLHVGHRSLSPHHIVVKESSGAPRYTVVDFRSALMANSGQTGRVPCGRMPYMAPEMMAGVPHHPLLVDRWSLGAVILELIAGSGALASAVHWDGLAQPSDAAAALARDSLEQNEVVPRIVRDFGAVGSPRAVNATAALLRPTPGERLDMRATLDIFATG